MASLNEQLSTGYGSVLIQRGVPLSFVKEIANRPIPWFSWYWLVAGAWFVLAYVAMPLSGKGIYGMFGWLYADQTATSDLFFSGNSFKLLVIMVVFSIQILPAWIAGFITLQPSYAAPGSKKALDNTAKNLRDRTRSELRRGVNFDARLADLADLPTADAFLAGVANLRAATTAARKAMALMALTVLTIAAFALAVGLYIMTSCDYTRIANNVIDYRFLGQSGSVPLSQVDGVAIDCVHIRATRHTASYWRTEYGLSFRGRAINLFDADLGLGHFSTAGNLAQMSAVDAYIQSHFNAISRLTPQAASPCIASWPDADPQERAELSRILTGVS